MDSWCQVRYPTRHSLPEYFSDIRGHERGGLRNAFTALATVLSLGIEWAPEKPLAKVLTFLGIEIASHNKMLRLPQGKRENLKAEVQQFYSLKKCTKRQLLSPIGKLYLAEKGLPVGRIFIRRLIDLAIARRIGHGVNLSQDTREDIE